MLIKYQTSGIHIGIVFVYQTTYSRFITFIASHMVSNMLVTNK